MGHSRTHVVIPQPVLKEIDAIAGRRGRSAFLTDLAQQEIKRRKLRALLARDDPFWKDENHPELRGGSARLVSKMRRADEQARKRK
jgi:hypothetical protein